MREHGDGAQDLAFVVDDATATYEAALARGARSVREPYELTDDQGTLRLAAIGTYGETKHTFVDRRDYLGYYCPGYVTTDLPPEPAGTPVGLERIDHVVGNVEVGKLDEWVAFYEDVDRLPPAAPLRRAPDRHRVQRARARRWSRTTPA